MSTIQQYSEPTCYIFKCENSIAALLTLKVTFNSASAY